MYKNPGPKGHSEQSFFESQRELSFAKLIIIGRTSAPRILRISTEYCPIWDTSQKFKDHLEKQLHDYLLCAVYLRVRGAGVWSIFLGNLFILFVYSFFVQILSLIKFIKVKLFCGTFISRFLLSSRVPGGTADRSSED